MIRKARKSHFAVLLPGGINFMHTPVAYHGGTMPESASLLSQTKSKFYTDKTLFFYAIKAYEDLRRQNLTSSDKVILNAGTFVGKTSVGKINKSGTIDRQNKVISPTGLSLIDVTNYEYQIRSCQLHHLTPVR